MNKYLSWVEIKKDALAHNIKEFKRITRHADGQAGSQVGGQVGGRSEGSASAKVAPCVKSNAYGHGLVETSKTFVEAGADWLTVNALYEAEELRSAGITVPIYVMGYTLKSDLKRAWELNVRLVVYTRETIDALAEIADEFSEPINLHIKVETGNNRQGVREEDLLNFAKYILEKGNGKLRIEGLATHFANIEDTTDHSYAFMQLERFKAAGEMLKQNGINVPVTHCANSAATILFPETHLDMCRIGISSYGMWPSKETFVAYQGGRSDGFELRPAFTWKSVVAQVKKVPKNEFIGYGCSCRTARDTFVAIVPVGYYDGYDRKLSNNAHVLIHGQRAKLLGRVCMNIIMVDVTDIAFVQAEDEVVLIGEQSYKSSGSEGSSGSEISSSSELSSEISSDSISPEEFASWIGSINYEVTTRVNDRIPRIFV